MIWALFCVYSYGSQGLCYNVDSSFWVWYDRSINWSTKIRTRSQDSNKYYEWKVIFYARAVSDALETLPVAFDVLWHAFWWRKLQPVLYSLVFSLCKDNFLAFDSRIIVMARKRFKLWKKHSQSNILFSFIFSTKNLTNITNICSKNHRTITYYTEGMIFSPKNECMSIWFGCWFP